MNTLIINGLKSTKVFKNINMLVFDMAGTTINENGLVYKILYQTIKDFGINIKQNDIDKWHSFNKYEVLDHFLINSSSFNNFDDIILYKNTLHQNFNNNLNKEYFNNDSIQLIHKNLPNLFNKIRQKNIKICLNTGFNKNIQESIIHKLNMNEFIDDYISSEDVIKGRPHPFMIQKLMKKHNINNPNTIIKFGDSKNDILEGLNSNVCASIGVLNGANNINTLLSAKPNMIINSVMDIDTSTLNNHYFL